MLYTLNNEQQKWEFFTSMTLCSLTLLLIIDGFSTDVMLEKNYRVLQEVDMNLQNLCFLIVCQDECWHYFITFLWIFL